MHSSITTPNQMVKDLKVLFVTICQDGCITYALPMSIIHEAFKPSQNMWMDIKSAIYICCLPFLRLTLLRGAYNCREQCILYGLLNMNLWISWHIFVRTSKVWHQNHYARTLCFLSGYKFMPNWKASSSLHKDRTLSGINKTLCIQTPNVDSINFCSGRIELQNKSKSGYV